MFIGQIQRHTAGIGNARRHQDRTICAIKIRTWQTGTPFGEENETAMAKNENENKKKTMTLNEMELQGN